MKNGAVAESGSKQVLAGWASKIPVYLKRHLQRTKISIAEMNVTQRIKAVMIAGNVRQVSF
ncbi:hypothetical protein ACLSYV_03725 [Avibacterium avium]|uniref:hypothetical protein n=1 Tax=Avibacterium avium TaxID=751 RepID=UPI003BF82036